MFRNATMRSASKGISSAAAAANRPMEDLESRQLCSVTVVHVAPDTLVLTGNAANDTVYLYDNGMGVVNGLATNPAGVLAPFGAFAGVHRIFMSMGAGRDYVNYQRYGDTLAGGATYINAKMGDGDDLFQFYAGNDIDLGPNAYVDLRVYGEGGKDTLTAFYRGELDGHLNVIFDGGDGDDLLHTEAKLDFGSAGGFLARSYGQAGNDNIDMLVRKANPADPAWVSAFASGGAGIDMLHRTALAFNDATCEFVWVVP
jgi:Ca2+-binding RTX toxin-like protein